MSARVGFVVAVAGLAFTEDGRPLDAFVLVDRYGPGGDGFVVNSDLATQFTRLPEADLWLDKHPDWAIRSRVINLPTGVVVRP